MCCSGDSTAKATEQAQAAMTTTLTNAFNTAFAAKMPILQNLTSTLTNMMQNPQGFSPQVLAMMRTKASDNVTAGTTAAQQAVNAYEASHGPTLGSGVSAQLAGSVAASGATELAKENTNINLQSGLLQNENYWRAIQGLTGVAQAYNPEGLANSEVGSANATADLSRAVLASEQAGWQNTFGLISGIAGLGTSAVGAFKGLGFAGGSASS